MDVQHTQSSYCSVCGLEDHNDPRLTVEDLRKCLNRHVIYEGNTWNRAKMCCGEAVTLTGKCAVWTREQDE